MKLMQHLHKRIFITVVGIPSAIYIGLGTYSHYHMRYGLKKVYPKSIWETSVAEKDTTIKNRQPIIDAVKKMFEMKSNGGNDISKLFSDDVLYEDPLLRCQGKQEFFKCFALLPWFWEYCSTDVFHTTHHENCIRVAYERNIKFYRLKKEVQRTSTLTLELVFENEAEKVNAVIDEWNGSPILAPNNSPKIGGLMKFYRILNAKWAFVYYPVQQYVYALYNTKKNAEIEIAADLLNRPTPQHSLSESSKQR